MRRPHAGKTLRLGFHHRAEVVAAVGALLLQVSADRGQVFGVERFGQQVAVDVGTHRLLHGMRREQRISAQRAQAGAAGPHKGGGVVGHAGAHRVQVDVARAAHEIVVAVHQTGLVAAFPQGAGPAMAGVERADVLAAQYLHHPAQGAGFGRGGQQVHVVVHQHVGMQVAAGGEQGVAQQVAVAAAVFVVQEAGQAIVAALHEVLRDAGQVKTGQAGHAGRMYRTQGRGHRQVPRVAWDDGADVGRK